MFDSSLCCCCFSAPVLAAALTAGSAQAALLSQGAFTDGGPAQNSGNFLKTTGSFGTVATGGADFTLDFAIPSGLEIGSYTVSFDIRLNDRPDIQVTSFPRSDPQDNQSFNNNVFNNDTGLFATPLDTWVRRQAAVIVSADPANPANTVWNGLFRTGSRLLVAQNDPTDTFDVDLDNVSLLSSSGDQQLSRLFNFEDTEVGNLPGAIALSGTSGTQRTVEVRAVPEPASLALLGAGGLLLGRRRLRA